MKNEKKEIIEEIKILKKSAKHAGAPNHHMSTILLDIHPSSFEFVMNKILKEFDYEDSNK